eukprot:3116614-Rhodomonas_salina.1
MLLVQVCPSQYCSWHTARDLVPAYTCQYRRQPTAKDPYKSTDAPPMSVPDTAYSKQPLQQYQTPPMSVPDTT